MVENNANPIKLPKMSGIYECHIKNDDQLECVELRFDAGNKQFYNAGINVTDRVVGWIAFLRMQ
jgi:hypothetical protein